MAELHFNARGSTHSLRLLLYDAENVWEALVDGSEYYYFEAPPDAEIWDLFSLAIDAYSGYRGEVEVEQVEWRKDGQVRFAGFDRPTWGSEQDFDSGCGCS